MLNYIFSQYSHHRAFLWNNNKGENTEKKKSLSTGCLYRSYPQIIGKSGGKDRFHKHLAKLQSVRTEIQNIYLANERDILQEQ